MGKGPQDGRITAVVSRGRLVAAVGLATVAAGGIAAGPAQASATMLACYSNSAHTVSSLKSPARSCAAGSTEIAWTARTGSHGPQGKTGKTGKTGARGKQGAQGSTGPQGLAGSPGAQGSAGAQGAQGAQGSQGSQGAQGVQGPQGTQGPQGAQGSNGVNAFYGYAGSYSYVSMPESTPTVVATVAPHSLGGYDVTATINLEGTGNPYCYTATKSTRGTVWSKTPDVFDYDNQSSYRDKTVTMTGVSVSSLRSTLYSTRADS